MATTAYSYSQIVSGFSGYFDLLTNATRRSLQKNAILLLTVTGTDATMRYAGSGSQPFYVVVDGVETKPTISGGAVTLFTGLADVQHSVAIIASGTTIPTYNWFNTTETQVITVTGAVPAVTNVPMEFATWSTFTGVSTLFTENAAGGNITPTEKPVNASDASTGTISFVSSCDTILLFAGNSPVNYSIDGGTIQTISIPARLTDRSLHVLATGLDSSNPHTYTIWPSAAGVNTQAIPQAVACLTNGVPVAMSAPPLDGHMYLYGASIILGIGGTSGGVDVFRVGLDTNLAVAKWGVSGMTIEGLTAAVPGYFLKTTRIPDYAMISVGRNNGVSGFQAAYTACIQAFVTAGCTKIICRGLFPEGSDLFPAQNAAIAAAVASFSNPDIIFMDTQTWTGIATSDGVHPTDAGYAQVAAYEIPALEAILTPNYTLTIDANGATSGTPPITADYPAGAMTLPLNTGNLAKSDNTLNGWNTLANGTGTHYALGGSYTMPPTTTTLYAEWLINPPVSAVKAISNTAPPVITGNPVVDSQLTASTGTWSTTPNSITYSWYRDGIIIEAEVSSTYTVVEADVGCMITCHVVANTATVLVIEAGASYLLS